MAFDEDARAEEIKALCRDHAEAMIQTLVEVATDPEQKGAARVVAARTMLERGFGAPERRVEKSVDVTVHDHRLAHLQALRTLADQRQPVNDIVDGEYEDITDDEEVKRRELARLGYSKKET